jgi:hypothetical protein
MASTRRKAAAAGLAVIGIAGLALASAAQLNINSSMLAAGSQVVTGCDDEVEVDYAVTGDEVTAVLLSDVAAACDDATFSLTLSSDTGTLVTEGGTLELVGDTTTVDLTSNVKVADVTGIAIVLH